MRPHTSLLLACALLAFPPLLAGCGQVITRSTPTPSPTSTAALTLTPAATRPPTSTPAPYTPAPTSTPTITPTPIVYTIRTGDTLLKVAQTFGLSVREIQDANGITDPRALRVGQELYIPAPEEATAGATPTVPPTPIPFAVENVTFSNSPLGGLWCLGEIRNTAGTELEQAGVTISLFDEQGNVVAQQDTYVELDLIRPGGRAPFAVRFASLPAAFANYLAVPWKGVQGYIGSYYLDLEARDLSAEGERYATYTVHGKLANVGPEDAVEVSVIVTVYDAVGRVIATRRGVPEHNVIPRGGETTFSVDLTPAGGPAAGYRVEALGRRRPTPTP